MTGVPGVRTGGARMDGDEGRPAQSAAASDRSVVMQAGRDVTVHGDVVVGDRGSPEMESVSAPSGLGRVHASSGVFVGRSGELARLDAALTRTGRAVVVAVHGLGGVGKSTVAARCVERQADRFRPVWWITADSPAAIDTGLAELAVALAPELAGAPLEQRTEAAVRWLATHDGWLVVLDNLTAPADAARLLARVRTGTVLITSRRRSGWNGVAEAVPLDVLPAEQAADLLTRLVRAEWPEADLTGADRLCAELGWLPLAVEQAGAYLAQARRTPAAYLDLLAEFPARMFTATAEGGDPQRTMARVWHVTLDRLSDTPLAGRVLHHLAWHAPEAIPRALLTSVFDEPDLSEALGRLAAYNMITLTGDTIAVHRLAQAVTRTPDPDDPHRQPADVTRARHATTTALSRALADTDPGRPADWPTFHAVLPHVRALLDHADPDVDTTQLCDLADHVALYFDSQGDTATAIALYTRTTRSRERLHGPDHPYTLASRGNLANAHWAAGDVEQAIPLQEATLVDSERVLGPDHPNTLATRNNLANAYSTAGDPEQALSLYEATLADRRRVLGADHPDTLVSLGNLAHAYQAAGDNARALSLYEATLADRQRVLGPDHPDTLTSLGNLAHAYQAAGDPERAIPLHEAAVAGTERVFGPDHPRTLKSRNNLAHQYAIVGDLARAIPLLETTLARSEQVLGPDHPRTLISLGNLGNAYETVRDPARAIPLYEAALAGRQRVLGPDHPDTLASRLDLARAYQAAGDLERAIPLHEATLADAERILGPDHPDTLACRDNLAFTYGAAGRVEQAIPLYEATWADRRRTLGPDHPKRLAALHKLAYAYDAAGDPRAVPRYEEALADSERLWGPDHPKTLTLRNNLAIAHHTTGDPARAIRLLEATLADRRRLLGPDHPDTLASCSNLAHAYESTGDLERAAQLYEETLAGCERVLGPDHPLTEVTRAKVSRARP
ncbi:tetratricopeptide repeat protein [Actinosynnema sp. NPDC091369]